MLNSKDLFQMIEEDHGTISRILEQIEDCGPDAVAKRLRLFSELKRLLTQQLLLERESLYQPLRTFSSLRPSVKAAWSEQDAVEKSLSKLAATPIASEAWSDRFETLLEDVEFHFSMEEADLLERVREEVGQYRCNEMAKTYQSLRRRSLTANAA